MYIQAVKSEIVSHISYFVAAKAEAFVIDPRRDCGIYLEMAQQVGAKIAYIFETHRNEDYVIGSVELSKLSGAKIIHGPGLAWKYGETLIDGSEYKVGSMKVKAIHTPGHSPDSSCYVLYDNETGDTPFAVFTGDTLFVGDVGRTDFLGSNNIARMSDLLYDGLHGKLLALGDGIIIYPGHGAGSVCGGSLAERDISTLGAERQMNTMLNLDREAFVKFKVGERHEIPPYFKTMEKYNLEGPPILGQTPKPRGLKPSEFKAMMEKGAKVVDIRSPPGFGGAHIPGSYNLTTNRLNNAGWVIPLDAEVLIVAEDAAGVEFASRNLFRIGYDKIVGYLAGGVEAWYKEGNPLSKIDMITPSILKTMIETGEVVEVIDVRRYNEYDEGHIQSAKHIYLGRIPDRLEEIPKDKPVAVICKTGSRSSFAASILLRAGRTRVYNTLGGMDAWKKLGYKIVF
jgi:hydroxyacylglutathione hydrolase